MQETEGFVSRQSRKSNTSRKARKRHTGRLALTLVCVVVVLAVLGTLYALFLKPNHSTLPAGKQVSFMVASGTSSAQITANLKQAGLIDSTTIFRVRLLRTGASASLKAGLHHIDAGWSYERIILELRQTPSAPAVKVTIPEGSSIAQIADILQTRLKIPSATFSNYASASASVYAAQYPFLEGAYGNSLEGFLFPDTYQFPTDITAPEVCMQMLARFNQVWTQLQSAAGATRQPGSAYSAAQLVTIASLVEKEVSVPAERPLVASVIYNRLDNNMRLQLCSTVQFLLPGPAKNKLRLTNADLATPSPYNTYLHAGLPPGPIANPGKAALQAALSPADTTYLYFVLTGKDGSQTFASTSKEFEAAKAKSKEVFGQ